jgi:hypothetical protein
VNDRTGVRANFTTYEDKLHNVDSTFAPFVLGNERLRLVETLRQLLLSYVSGLTGGYKPLKKNFIFVGKDGFQTGTPVSVQGATNNPILGLTQKRLIKKPAT